MFQKTITLFSVLLFSLFSSAADSFQYENLGFSADGRFYAFTQHVVQDGSGFLFAETWIVDVARDNLIHTGVAYGVYDEFDANHIRTHQPEVAVLIVGESEAGAMEKVISESQKKADLGTWLGQANLGEELVVHASQRFDFGKMVRFFIGSGEATISLTEKNVTPKAECYWDEAGKGFRLTFAEEDTHTILHEDRETTPASRGCVISYEIGQVYYDASSNSLAVSVIVETVGFEGPDYTYMVVTKKF